MWYEDHLKKFLEKIGRKDLIKQDYENTVKMQKLTPLIDDEEEETTEEIKECTLPKKLEYIDKDEYLDKRGS